MSDYNSSLPVRTEQNGDVVSAICDGTLSSQKLAIDASGRITAIVEDGGGSITVDASALDIRPLTNADVVTAEQGGTWNINNISGTISLPTGAATAANQATEISSLASIDGKLPATLGQKTMANSLAVVLASDQSAVSVSIASLPLPLGAATEATLSAINAKLVSGTDIGDVTVNNGSGASAVNIQDGGNSITVDATSLDIRALTSSDVVSANIRDASGTAFSNSNPLPVFVTSTASGTDVLDFKQASAIAAGSNDTHTYTVTALKTLNLQKIQATASGKIKVEIYLNAVLKAVMFNSTSAPNCEYMFSSPQTLGAGLVVGVKIYNLDKAAMDLYSTIEGFEA